jgi:hypothetical protein
VALKQLRREDLSDEEIKELEKLYSDFQKKVLLTFLGYLFSAFVAAIIVIVINKLYINDSGFEFFGCLGTGVVFLGGLQGNIEELRDILVKEIQRFVKN